MAKPGWFKTSWVAVVGSTKAVNWQKTRVANINNSTCNGRSTALDASSANIMPRTPGFDTASLLLKLLKLWFMAAAVVVSMVVSESWVASWVPSTFKSIKSSKSDLLFAGDFILLEGDRKEVMMFRLLRGAVLFNAVAILVRLGSRADGLTL